MSSARLAFFTRSDEGYFPTPSRSRLGKAHLQITPLQFGDRSGSGSPLTTRHSPLTTLEKRFSCETVIAIKPTNLIQSRNKLWQSAARHAICIRPVWKAKGQGLSDEG